MSNVLIVYDRPNWCLHFAARGIKQHWTGSESIEIACQDDPDIDEKVRGAGKVVAMCRGTYQKIRSDPRRTLVAVGSHKVLPNALYTTQGDEFKYRIKTKELLRGVAGVLCANLYLLNEWAYYHTHACYCPIGFDPALFTPCACPPLDGRVVLGWAGDPRRPEKLYSEVVYKACERLAKHIELRVATPGTFIPHDELRDRFYSGLHAFIVASTSEGGPQPAIEAMACSVPVLSTRVGILNEVIQDGVTGWFFDGTVSGLVDRINKVREDWEWYLTARRHVAEAVKQLSWVSAVKWWMKAVRENRR